MPASRRARAMILAPRSWPSRPGLATTTRIFFSVEVDMGPAILKRWRLAVGAEHCLERLHHLALSDVGAGRLHEQRHQVLLRTPGRLLQKAQDGLRRRAV